MPDALSSAVQEQRRRMKTFSEFIADLADRYRVDPVKRFVVSGNRLEVECESGAKFRIDASPIDGTTFGTTLREVA